MTLPKRFGYPPAGLYPPRMALPWEEISPSEIEETDDELVAYWNTEEASYRTTLETYFPRVAPHLPGYDYAPYKVTVLRMGKNGLIVGHTPSDAQQVVVKPLSDVLDKPSGSSWTIYEVGDRIEAMRLWFNFAGGSYSLERAEGAGAYRAFHDALLLLWHVQEASWFEAFVRGVLEAEGVRLADETLEGADLLGDVVVSESLGYRRVERWAYRVRGPETEGLTEASLAAISDWLDEHADSIVGCGVVTADDRSALGSALRVEDPRIRLIDRPLLVQLAHDHPHLLDEHLAAYGAALARASEESPPLAPRLRARLRSCPPGRVAYAQFEKLAQGALTEIFGDSLGAPRTQKATRDGVRRPDAVYPIRSSGSFWERIRARFGADFLVVDFKNYKTPVKGAVIDDAAKYGADAVGNLVLVVSREGMAERAKDRAIRVYRDRTVCVLVVGDDDLIAMAELRDIGEPPEALLNDRLDEFLTSV